MIPSVELWQLECYDLAKIKLGSFGKVNADRKKLFKKNLLWLLRKLRDE